MMIRIYARENATQRGNNGTALAGSIFSAIWFLTKGVWTGDLGRFLPRSPKALETIRGDLVSGRGLGKLLILEFVKDLPSITEYTVQQQLAILKSSGDYDRITIEVCEEVEREAERFGIDADVIEKVREIADDAADHKVTFDFGVAQHFKSQPILPPFVTW